MEAFECVVEVGKQAIVVVSPNKQMGKEKVANFLKIRWVWILSFISFQKAINQTFGCVCWMGGMLWDVKKQVHFFLVGGVFDFVGGLVYPYVQVKEMCFGSEFLCFP